MNNSPISLLPAAGLTFTGTPSPWPLISAEVISSQPLSQAQQHYLNQLLTNTQQSTHNSLMKALGQPTALPADNNANGQPPGKQALQLVRLLIADQPRWLLADKPQQPGDRIQLQVTPKGLIMPPPTDNKPQTPANQPASTPSQTAPQVHAERPTPPEPKNLNTLIERWLSGARPAAPSQTTEAAISQLLRQAISQSTPVTSSHQTLSQLPTLSQAPSLLRAVANTALSLPADAQQVKTAIQQSGLFAEARLPQLQESETQPVQPVPTADAKLLLWSLQALSGKKPGGDLLQKLLNLLQLPSDWTPDPKQLPQLKAEIRGWLASITRQQLQLLGQQQADGVESPRLQLELPVKSENHTLPLQLTIEKHWQRLEEQDGHDGKRTSLQRIAEWSFSLSIDIPEQGPLDVRLRSDGMHLSCTLWTDSPPLEASINQRLSQLARSMEEDGIELSQIRCLPGRMPNGCKPHQTPLLDTRA